jgi:CheY-like chemotaxis protein
MDALLTGVVRSLPYARRFARALTRHAARGDGLVESALERIVAGAVPQRPGLRAEHWLYAGAARLHREDCTEGWRDALQRQMLLLRVLERLTLDQACAVIGVPATIGDGLLRDAWRQVRQLASADTLIIEDEAVVALHIEQIMTGCGHRVVGIAGTADEAVRLAAATRPGLILADVNLGAGGHGPSVVARILQTTAAPTIFVTAYPETLLSGDKVEPAFVVCKPFDARALAVASYQAVSGGAHRL